MNQQAHIAPDGAGGRLVYLAENLAALHAATSVSALAGRVVFLGERALGAVLSVLAIPDETGAYRAVLSGSPLPASARAVWEGLHIDALSTNLSAGAAFGRAQGHSRACRYPLSELFPERECSGSEEALVAPITRERELIGIALFVVGPDEATDMMATILVDHVAVAIHQLWERDDARRLHFMDGRLWVPDEIFLLAQFRREVARSRRYGHDAGIALLRFESETDVRAKFGDFYANHLMRRIGSQLLANLRNTDVVGALDGGYAVIYADTSLDGTELSTQRLRDAVLEMIAVRFPEIVDPEVSFRAAAYPVSGSTVEDLVRNLVDDGTSLNHSDAA